MERNQAQRVNLAAKKDVRALPKKEVSVGDMEQIALPKRAVMKDVQTFPKKEVPVKGTEER